jgi:hypothetical protein
MTELARGLFVEVDGLVAVVVGLPGEEDVPEEHVALWFGAPRGAVLKAKPAAWPLKCGPSRST